MMKQLFDYVFEKMKYNYFERRFEESFAPSKGEVKFEIFEDDRCIESRPWDDNLIVTNSFNILASLLETADSEKRINTISLGDEGIIDSKMVFPELADKTLRNETFRKTGTESIIVDNINKTIQFNFRINEDEANGLGARIYNEAGLLTNDGNMFSRKVFTELVKTPDQTILVYWRLRWDKNK